MKKEGPRILECILLSYTPYNRGGEERDDISELPMDTAPGWRCSVEAEKAERGPAYRSSFRQRQYTLLALAYTVQASGGSSGDTLEVRAQLRPVNKSCMTINYEDTITIDVVGDVRRCHPVITPYFSPHLGPSLPSSFVVTCISTNTIRAIWAKARRSAKGSNSSSTNRPRQNRLCPTMRPRNRKQPTCLPPQAARRPLPNPSSPPKTSRRRCSRSRR